MQTINVQTTQNVSIEYPVASLGDRIVAYIIDRILVLIFVFFMILVMDSLRVDSLWWIWLILIVGPIMFYHLAFEIFMNGQSPGKRIMNIQVVKLDGREPSIGEYLMRWVLSLVDFYILSGAVAVIAIAASGKGQRIGDIAAGTTVVKLIPGRQVDARNLFVTTEDTYVPVFPQVAQLESRDIEIVQRALQANVEHGNSQPLIAVSEKLRTMLRIETDLLAEDFLRTVVRDFNHLTSR